MGSGEPWGLLLLLFVPLVLFITRGVWRRRRQPLAAYHLLRSLANDLPLLPRSYTVRRKIQQALLAGAILAFALAGADLVIGAVADEPVTVVFLLDNQLPPGETGESWGTLAAAAAAYLADFRSDDRVMLLRADGVGVSPGFLGVRQAAALVRSLSPSALAADVEASLKRLRIIGSLYRPAVVAIVSADPGRWSKSLSAAEASRWRLIPLRRSVVPVNYAILDVELLPDLLRRDRLTLFCRVGVFAGHGADIQPLALSVRQGDTMIASRSLTLDAGGTSGLVFTDLAVTTGLLSLNLEPADRYPADNVFLSPVRTDAYLKTKLITARNPALAAALQAIPGVVLNTAETPGPDAAPGHAVSVFDRVPVDPGARAFVAVDPPGTVPGLTRRDNIDFPTLIEADGASPLLHGVQFAGLHVRRLTAFIPQPGIDVLVRAAGYPLILAGRTLTGQRFSLLAFDPVESGWVHDPSFPILVANLVGWVGAGAEAARSAFLLGETLPADLAATTRSVTDPHGVNRRRPIGGWGQLALDVPGRYRIGGENSGDLFANHLSESLSRATVETSGTAPLPPARPLLKRPFRLNAAPLLLWAGILLLCVEMFLAPRVTRGRLPS